jgi:hypothetical protein
VAADTDSSQDIYERVAGTTVLVSAGAINGNGAYAVTFRGASADGSRIFFTTRERLVTGDSDPAPGSCVTSTCSVDVYERYAGTTSILSLVPSGDNGNRNATWGGNAADGTRVWYTTAKPQTAADTDTAQDVYQSRVPSGYARPKGAGPLYVSLVPAYVPCSAPNRQHAEPLGHASCNPPALASQWLTMGTPDANSRVTNFRGSVKLTPLLGNAGTPEDDADVRLVVNMTDVRKASDLSDYTGEALVTAGARLTDRLNGSAPVDAATVADFDYRFAVPCAATADPNIGATCATLTSMDALVPGTVVENARMMWAFEEVQVYDGGSDGLAATEPNTLYAVQGIFAP